MPESAVTLLSGGLDSTVLLYWVKDRYDKVAPLYIHYGSKHSSKELRAAKATCEALNLSLQEIDAPSVLFRNSALTHDALSIPTNLDQTIDVVVPFRNLTFVVLAASYAESIGSTTIALAPTREDYSVFRDCRRSFFDSLERTLSEGSKFAKEYHVLTPFINYTKEEIIALGVKLDVDFKKTWSCYQGGASPCGVCPACRVRQKGFAFAGVPDPLAS